MSAWVVALTLLLAPAARADDGPACPQATGRVTQALDAQEFLDAHTLALTFDAVCPDAAEAPTWRILDALALAHLDERRARSMLAELALSPNPHVAARAAVLLSWSDLRAGDRIAFGADVMKLAPADRARVMTLAALGDEASFDSAASVLDPELRSTARKRHRQYLDARQRSPALAGGLSAIIPGLGQLYAGSWEGALLALTLNAVLIGATIELGQHDLWLSASVTGVAGSIFYVGNILNAADLAARRNDSAQAGPRAELERLLVPESVPGP